MQRLVEALQQENVIRIKMEAVCLDSTGMKVHPNGTGALKKAVSRELVDHEEDSQPSFIWSPHLAVRRFHSRSRQEMRVMVRKGGNS